MRWKILLTYVFFAPPLGAVVCRIYERTTATFFRNPITNLILDFPFLALFGYWIGFIPALLAGAYAAKFMSKNSYKKIIHFFVYLLIVFMSTTAWVMYPRFEGCAGRNNGYMNCISKKANEMSAVGISNAFPLGRENISLIRASMLTAILMHLLMRKKLYGGTLYEPSNTTAGRA